MATFTHAGHDGKAIALDLCAPCRSVWFDETESIGLAGTGWVDLLQRLVDIPPELPIPTARAVHECPRCRKPLQLLHNQSRYGRYRLHACGRCGGHFQHQSWLLAQHGFCRPLRGPDRLALAREGRALQCQPCGAPIEAHQDACTHCRTQPLVLDPARLAQALRRQPEARAADSVPVGTHWPCRACGQPLDPSLDQHCRQCGHLVLVCTMAELQPVLDITREALGRQTQTSARWRQAPRPGSLTGLPVVDAELSIQLQKDRAIALAAMTRFDHADPHKQLYWRVAAMLSMVFATWLAAWLFL